MKKYLFILCLIAFKSSFAQNKPNFQYVITEKNPGISFALSAVLPGAGEMYNNQVGLGLVIFLGDAALIGGGYAIYYQYSTVNDFHTDFNKEMSVFLMTTGVVLDLAQMIYAPIYSRHLNIKNGFNSTSFNLKLKGNQLALSYSF